MFPVNVTAKPLSVLKNWITFASGRQHRTHFPVKRLFPLLHHLRSFFDTFLPRCFCRRHFLILQRSFLSSI